MKKVALLDVCHPEYFTGYHRAVIGVPVYYGMTFQDLAEDIELEMTAIWDFLEDDYNKEEISLFDSYIQECKDKGAKLFITYPETPEDVNDDDSEMPFAYFAVINLVYRNGLMFLDN